MVCEVRGNTSVYGVIGHPIEHTLSPKIHNLLIKELKYNSIYVPFNVYSDSIKDAVNGAVALRIKGLNITIPHKQNIIPYLMKIDSFAEKVGAVNTIKLKNDGYEGYNTDVYGLLKLLTVNKVYLKGKKVLIIGAGGAARAAAIMCADEAVSRLYIANRTYSRAVELKNKVKKYYKTDIQTVELDKITYIKDINICIQTTSVGMYPHVMDTPVKNEDFYKGLEVAVDIIYNPSKTVFLQKAQKYGVKTINGFGMLFYQAVKAFEIWNGIEFPFEIQNKVYKIIEEDIKRKKNE